MSNSITTTIEASDAIFSMTGFNYEICSEENSDGTETHTFDCKEDLNKFKQLLKTL